MPKKVAKVEADSVYFLKLLLYFTLGTIWLKINGRTVVPIGLILGVIFSTHEHFRIDRKIEYAVLLVAALLGLAGFGVFLGISF
ncbi:MAG TPA: hypothetical protein VLE72_03990 [Candidatus Saccharimonadales bacterium]|nr:hypothetical protein [Candidatus Saccharimonadales bacterium]